MAPRLIPPITLPRNTTDVSIKEDGTISASLSDAIDPVPVGRIEITRFINPQGLKAMGGNLYLETAASGPAVTAFPQEDGAGSLQQGFLEGSNVDPVKELVGLIKTQRSFELNSQSIQTADQALQTVANLRRG